MTRFARLVPYGLAIVFTIALAMAATDAAALTANPDGEWSGTVKCPNANTQSGLTPIVNLGPFNVLVGIDGSFGIVVNRFATGVNDALYIGAYYPDPKNPTTKGILGFALFGASDPPVSAASETGQAKIETKGNGQTTLEGKTYLLADFVDLDAVSVLCEWKLTKTADICTTLCP